MKIQTSLLIVAIALFGAFPLGLPLVQADIVPCDPTRLVTAWETQIVSESQPCLPPEAVLASSLAASQAVWLYDATPGSVCTILWWTVGASAAWYGADCYADDRAADPASLEPCSALNLTDQVRMDLCGPLAPGAGMNTASDICVDPVLPELFSTAAQICIPDPICPDCLDVDPCEPGQTGPFTPACIKEPQPCPSTEFGIYEPACVQNIDPCTINTINLLICNPPPCDPDEVGVPPVCVTVVVCPNGQVGAYVNDFGTCEPIPQPCPEGEIGYGPVCETVSYSFCDPPQTVGAQVNGIGTCQTPPQPCPEPQVGYGPVCETVSYSFCDPPQTVGAQVNGIGTCQPIPPIPQPCPTGYIGYGPVCQPVPCPQGLGTNPLSVCGYTPPPPPPVPQDQDNDGYTDSQEGTAGSNAYSANSNPGTDDDGDGTINPAEPNSGVNQARAACTGSYGVVYAVSCNGYASPVGVSGYAGADSGNRVWVWDGLCTPAGTGSYAACKTTSNYALNTATYSGGFTADGYGWRHVTNVPTIGPQSVPVVLPCTTFAQDLDGDGVSSYRFCSATLTVYPTGATTTTQTGFLVAAGDPNDADASNPKPQVTDGPYNTVERVTGDGVHYKVGMKFVFMGTTYNYVQENTVDAGALPFSITVPSGQMPVNGPDADNDGLVSYVDVPMQKRTINDDAALSQTTTSALPQRIPVDNNDQQPVIPPGTLPVTQTLPTGADVGPDVDGDGVPRYVVMRYSDVSVGGSGLVSVTRNPGQDKYQAVDPDDSNPNNPKPPVGGPQPVSLPGQSVSQPIQGVSTPNIPSQNQPYGPVVLPATCTAFVCTAPTPILPGSTVPVPGVGVPSSQQICTTASVMCDGQNRVCDPGTKQVCIGPFGPIPVVPPTTVPVPPVGAPAICQAAPSICLPPTTIVPAGTLIVPGLGPIPVTPAITVSVQWTGFNGVVDSHAGDFNQVGPFTVSPGGIPITVCAQTCPVPIAPEAHGQGSITVIAVVGTQTYSHTQPIAF